MDRRKLGSEKEAQACAYLENKGVTIIEQNFQCRQGELDIIGSQGGYLLFVEVKYRSSTHPGQAEAAVDIRKQIKICKAADYYRYTRHYGEDTAFRYDVIAMQGKEIIWYQNAFEHIGG